MEHRDTVSNNENTLDLSEIYQQIATNAEFLMAKFSMHALEASKNVSMESLELQAKMALLEEKIESQIDAIKVALNDTITRTGKFWISVKDKLPTEDGVYEVCFEATKLFNRHCGRLYFLNGHWEQNPCAFHLDIIYWMPIPKPPAD